MNKILSIVTVTFNSAQTLQRTFDSIAAQKNDKIEYIVIDGNSTDQTLEIVKHNSSIIDFWLSEPDSGIYGAMNKGIRHARGKYVAFMNSDDWYEPGSLQKSLSVLEESQADIVYGDTVIYWEQSCIGIRKADRPTPGKILKRMPFCHQSCFVSLEAIKEQSGFEESYRVVSDFNMIISIMKNKNARAEALNFAVSAFSVGGASSNLQKAARETYIIHRKHGLNFLSSFLLYIKWLFIAFIKKISPSFFEEKLRVIKTKYKL